MLAVLEAAVPARIEGVAPPEHRDDETREVRGRLGGREVVEVDPVFGHGVHCAVLGSWSAGSRQSCWRRQRRPWRRALTGSLVRFPPGFPLPPSAWRFRGLSQTAPRRIRESGPDRK